MGVWLELQSVKSIKLFEYNMKSITLASIVFTLSFCLNLEAGKNLPYKGSPNAETQPYLGDVEDTEDNNGKRGTYLSRTKRKITFGGDCTGCQINNAPGGQVDICGNIDGTKLTGDRDGIRKRCPNMSRTKRKITFGGDVKGGQINNAPGGQVDVGGNIDGTKLTGDRDGIRERGTYLLRTKRKITFGGDVKGGHINNAPGGQVDVGGNIDGTKLTGDRDGIRAGRKIYVN